MGNGQWAMWHYAVGETLKDLSQFLNPWHWPGAVWFWLAASAYGGWKWLRTTIHQAQAKHWPLVIGRVLYTHVDKEEHENSASYTAVIEVEFEREGKFYGGKYEKRFGSERMAKQFVSGLDKMPIELRYDPSTSPYRCVMPEAVDALVAQRPSHAYPEESEARFNGWHRPLMLPVALCALVGFAGGAWVHGQSLLGRKAAGMPVFIALHFCCLALAFFFGEEASSFSRVRDLLQYPFQPEALKYVCAGTLLYAVVNFGWSLYLTEVAGAPLEGALMWRMFSGHWMAFYALEFSFAVTALSGKQDTAAVPQPDWMKPK